MTTALANPSTLPVTSDPRVIALSLLDALVVVPPPRILNRKGKLNGELKKQAKMARQLKRDVKKQARKERKEKFLADRALNGISAGPLVSRNHLFDLNLIRFQAEI